MNINVNLNADAIWQQLDIKDGTKDSKINNSVWNEFADITGGNHINEFIDEKNALRSINSYLKRASKETINNICKFLGWNNSDSNINEEITTSDNLLEKISKNPSMISEITEGENDDGSSWKKAKLSDGRFIQVNYTADGSIESVNVSTDPKKTLYYNDQYGDGTEIDYSEDGISIALSKEADVYAATVNKEGYDFSKYQKLAEQIFGEKSVAVEDTSFESISEADEYLDEEEEDDFYYNAHVIAVGDNGYTVWRDNKTKEIRYCNNNHQEISPEEFKEFCPNIYNQIETRKTESVITRGDNGWYVTQDINGKYYYYDSKDFERNESDFEKACPNIYHNLKK